MLESAVASAFLIVADTVVVLELIRSYCHCILEFDLAFACLELPFCRYCLVAVTAVLELLPMAMLSYVALLAMLGFQANVTYNKIYDI